MTTDLGFVSVRDESKPAKGGDIIFTSGKGYVPPLSPDVPEHGDIRFVIAGGQEMLRLCGDGKVIVRGEQVDNNRAAYDAFLAWLADTFGWNKGVASDEAIAGQMRRWIIADEELEHSQADKLLVSLLESLGYTKTVEAYKQVGKWYS